MMLLLLLLVAMNVLAEIVGGVAVVVAAVSECLVG